MSRTLKLLAGLCAVVALAACAPQDDSASAQPPGSESPSNGPHAEPKLIAEHETVTPGDTFLAALKLKLEDTWHVYWKNQGDSGLPPTVEWTSSEGIKTGEFKWPAPIAVRIATLMNYGYEHEVILPFEVTVPVTAKAGDQVSVAGKFNWLICQAVCVPEKADLSLKLPVGSAPKVDETASSEIAKYLATTPRPLAGVATVERTKDGFRVAATDPDLAAAARTAKSMRFFPETDPVENAADQTIKRGEAGVSVVLKASDFAKVGDQPVPGIFVAEASDGTLKSWEAPSQPGKIPEGVSAASVNVSAQKNGVNLAEIVLMIGGAFLGGLILNLMPCVLPVLAIKAAGLVHTAHNPKESRAHGIAYLGGVLTCFAVLAGIIVGFQLAGQQLGLGFQLQYPPAVTFFTLVIFAIGLNLLGVFEMGGSLMGVGDKLADQGGVGGAYFTGLLAAFVGAPCIGPFMTVALGWALTQPPVTVIGMFLVIGLGLAAPFVLLSFTPAVAKVLPKPGRWMATFRQVLAFPMFATMLWLMWVVAGQAGSDGVIVIVAGLIVVGFGIWLATKIGKSLLGRLIAALVILFGFLGPSIATAGIKAPAGGQSLAEQAGAEPWSADRVADLRKQGRVIFIDFTARWCVTCQVNKSVAIDSASVRQAFADYNVAFLVADWTNQDSVIAAALAEHGRAGVPLYLVYPASGGEPAVLPQILSPGLVVKAIKDAAA